MYFPGKEGTAETCFSSVGPQSAPINSGGEAGRAHTEGGVHMGRQECDIFSTCFSLPSPLGRESYLCEDETGTGQDLSSEPVSVNCPTSRDCARLLDSVLPAPVLEEERDQDIVVVTFSMVMRVPGLVSLCSVPGTQEGPWLPPAAQASSGLFRGWIAVDVNM